MRAVGVVEYGGPEVLHVHELPDPRPGPGQLLIRVRAAAVNPTDTYTRNGSRHERLKVSPPPYVPGMDAAGVVEAVGEGVDTDLQVGERVMAMVVPAGSNGAYAELVTVPAEAVVRQPAGASDVEAATLPMNGLTARLTLDLLDLPAGATIAVTGAAGAYGGYVVQLAKADGLRVIADASEADEQLVKDLGADVVVRRGDDVTLRILEAAPDGVAALADGAVMGDRVVAAVRDGGTIATVRGHEGSAERGITFKPVWVREYALAGDKLDRLRQQVEAGALTLRVAGTFTPDEAHEAHRILEAGGTRGRLVITF